MVLLKQGERPIKAKVRDDADVVIRDVFPMEGHPDMAGGFTYDGGSVGTGFDRETLRDMMRHPERYRGRTARIRHQGRYDSGAYR